MKTNIKDVVIVVFIILFASAFIIVLISINPIAKDKCTYDNNIQLQKARFDFVNALNNYTYDTLKVDFAYALQYVRCN
jgi:hypothetical protein